MLTAFEFCFRIYHYDVQVNQNGLKLNGTHQVWSNLMMLIYVMPIWEKGVGLSPNLIQTDVTVEIFKLLKYYQ
jgi:hypothetical protein